MVNLKRQYEIGQDFFFQKRPFVTARNGCCGKLMFSLVFVYGSGWLCLVPYPFWGGYAWSQVPSRLQGARIPEGLVCIPHPTPGNVHSPC